MTENGIQTDKRNYGIDLLRIVSMLMITAIHVTGEGGILLDEKLTATNKAIIWIIRVMIFFAVDCYALISGYVGIHSKQKLSSLADLWLRVAFYSVGISTILFFLRPDIVTLGTVFKSFLPVTNDYYWYFTAYFGMWFFIPLVNAAVNNIPKQKLKLIIIGAFILLTPGNLVNNSFQFDSGYSAAWLLFLYLVGAYIGKYNLFQKTPAYKPLIAYSISIIICVFLRIAFTLCKWDLYGSIVMNHSSPVMLVCAVSLLALFCNIRIPNFAKKLIGFFAPLSFSVYLIHTHPIFFYKIFNGKFSFLAEKSPLILVLGIIISTFSIYFICVFIDFFRQMLFKLLKIKNILVFAEKKFWNIFNKKSKKEQQ